jgi:Tfp pilus assembly protein PilF
MGACAPVVTNTSLSSGNRVELERRAEIRIQLATAYYSEGQYATALSEPPIDCVSFSDMFHGFPANPV